MSKAISRAKQSLDKAVTKQKRKRALAKAAPALKTAGKAVAVLSVLAGAGWVARAVSKKRTAEKKVATKRKRAIAATATVAGATAIAARVRRGKNGN